MAKVSANLAKKCIVANVIAGYFHDHIFVPLEMVEMAVKVLVELGTERGSVSMMRHQS
jgi:hypothetical protein